MECIKGGLEVARLRAEGSGNVSRGLQNTL